MDSFRATYLKDIRGSDGARLEGKRIVLAISGSVAAVECPRLARALMRQGADVWVCMTPSAAGIVTPTAMQWCTGNPVVSELTGWVEHLFLAGEWQGRADLVLVAPATANTVGKMACGIDDTVVTTVAATAIGAKVPVVVAPGMHAVMSEHPAFIENLQRLRAWGARVVGPVVAEAKAKMASVESIVDEVCAALAPGDLCGRRIVITAGPTVEFLDAVRVVTNLSSGRMGVALASSAARRGASVTLVYGPGTEPPPPGVHLVRVMTGAEMMEAVRVALSEPVDVAVFAAAVSDFAPASAAAGKVPTDVNVSWTVELVRTPKILQAARGWTSGLLVAFKAEAVATDEELLAVARAHQEKSGADLTVANRVGPGRGFLVGENEVYVVDRDGGTVHIPMASKALVADRIWDEVARRLNPLWSGFPLQDHST